MNNGLNSEKQLSDLFPSFSLDESVPIVARFFFLDERSSAQCNLSTLKVDVVCILRCFPVHHGNCRLLISLNDLGHFPLLSQQGVPV